jgi:translocation and assembly module TamA
MRCVKRWSKGRSIFGIALTGILATGLILAPVSASAFDFFGLFGSDEPPNPSPSTLPYRVEFVVHGDDGVKDALQDSSNFYKLRQDPPPDGEALAQRLTADFAPMLDALWGSGYYNARIIASVGPSKGRQGASARGQRAAPRPIRNASTTFVPPGSLPENRLGFGSPTSFLNGATSR